MRSEFEKNRYWIGLFRTDVEFNGSLGEFGRYELNGSRDVDHSYLEAFNSKWEAYAKAWQHQQSKVDELQNNINLLNEALDIKEQLNQKLREREDELQKQLRDRDLRIKRLIESEENIGRGCESWRNACSKLWKIEDAVTKVLKSMRKELEHGHLSDDEFKTLSSYANDLEQALKGEG